MGLPLHDPKKANALYVQRLFQTLGKSRYVSRAVVLALDGVYRDGRLDLSQTDFLISNNYLFQVVKAAAGKFLAGASINPTRRDALDELDRCAAMGAVLIKVLPNTQGFDPADPHCLPFYKALAAKGIPLLCHIGNEFSLPSPWRRFTEPESLRTALDQGVTVIAAHGATRGTLFRDHFIRQFEGLTRSFPNLFADLSALSGPNRMNALSFYRDRPELHERLLFATDYPVPVWTLPLWGRASLGNIRQIRSHPSPFDRHVLILKEFQIRFRSFPEVLTPSSRS